MPPLPSSPPLGFAPLATDARDCESAMRVGSKSFFAAARVLPRRVRAPAIALYAFCRMADDVVDTFGAGSAQVAALHERLARIYANDPCGHACDRAFAQVVRRYRIPFELPAALLEGFEWDAAGRRYRSLDDLYDYAARVAGSVGAMMALIMGVADRAACARACELGVAMQLTNIARDVGEDARNGRLYLPLEWLLEAGIDPQSFLGAPSFDERIAAIVARLLAAADRLYRRAEAGIAALPRDCRPAIRAARLIYAEIGRELERRGLDSINGRAVVGSSRKLALVARALGAWAIVPRVSEAIAQQGGGEPVPLPAIGYLVDAMALDATRAARDRRRRSFDARMAWVVEVFERLEERDRRIVAVLPERRSMHEHARAYVARRL